MRYAVIAVALIALAGAGRLSYRTWQDTHPRFPTKTYDLREHVITTPAHWPPPKVDEDFISIHNAADLREGSLDQFDWYLSVHDRGSATTIEAVLKEMRAGYTPPPPEPVDMTLANGIVTKTWTVWESRGELNQEHRAYVFNAPNGHVYSTWQPLSPRWRTKRRYDNLFREILGSMKFKDSPAKRPVPR